MAQKLSYIVECMIVITTIASLVLIGYIMMAMGNMPY